MTENGLTPVEWGHIEEVDVNNIPPATGSRYLPLFREVNLRLEQTSPTCALRVPIGEPKVLDGAMTALRKMFTGHTPPVVVLKRAGALFVYLSSGQSTARVVNRGGRPRKSPSIAEMGNGNGRRLDLPDLSQVMDEMGHEEEV